MTKRSTNPSAAPPARLARADAARNTAEAAFIQDGEMDSPRLNKLFAPAMLEAGATKSGSYWLLRGKPVCTGMWLQRSQWSRLWYVNIGACLARNIPGKLYEFPWTDRRYVDTLRRRGSRGDLLDFEDIGMNRSRRLREIRTFAERLAAEMQILLDVRKLRTVADRSDQAIVPRFREWLRKQSALVAP
ncbi:MAG TPA: hypothetical protein VFF69_07400 [Phycisphaerales bacterium]|nr:hypothetical protein [Phycisphaerales bacterium]